MDRTVTDETSRNKVLLHYDFHGENIMVNEDDMVATLDWAEARIGDPAFDVAWTSLILGNTGEENLMEPFIYAYKRYSGRDLENLASYGVIASVRQLSDLIVLKEAGAHASGKRSDAAKLFDLNTEIRKAAEFIQERTDIDLSAAGDGTNVLFPLTPEDGAPIILQQNKSPLFR